MDAVSYFNSAKQDVLKWRLNDVENYRTCRPIESIQQTAVIGGGTMGRGIAIALCSAGYHVTLVEANETAKENCRKGLEAIFDRLVDQKRMTKEQKEMVWSVLNLTTSFNDLRNVDFVIEAIFEDLQLKKELFSKLTKICKPDVLFATNTSNLSLDEMASCVNDPSRLVGMHFFNPPPIVPIVEVVYGKHTSGDAVATAFDLTEKMRKVPVLVKNSPSFVVNRMLAWYVGQSTRLCSEFGFLPEEVDNILRDFGFPIGPLAMMDMNGLDISQIVFKTFTQDMGLEYRTDPLVDRFVKMGRLGRKTGAGWYKYIGTGKRVPDITVENEIRKITPKNKIKMTKHDVIQFLLYPVVNEAFKILQDGIVPKAEHLDLMWVLACGWPKSKGGPLFWGATEGWRKIYSYVENQYKYGEDPFWKPADKLKKLAAAHL